MCGCWVELCTTSWPSREFQCATTPRPSSGLMAWREVRSSRVTETAALALTASKSTSVGGGEEEIVAPVLVHQRRAGLARRQHVGDGGQRLEVELDLGGHVLGLGAASARRTWRRARRRSAPCPWPGPAAREDLKPGSAVSARIGGNARQILGDEDAVAELGRDAASPLMRACASGLRRNATSCMPGSLMSPTYWPRPRMKRSSSLRSEPRADALVDDVPCHALLPRLLPHSFYL